MSGTRGGCSPPQGSPHWSIQRWLGTGAAALALGLGVCAGQAVAAADAGDGTPRNTGDGANGTPAGRPAKSLTARPTTDSPAATKPHRVRPSAATTGEPQLRPPHARVVGDQAHRRAGIGRAVEAAVQADPAPPGSASSVVGITTPAPAAGVAEPASPTPQITPASAVAEVPARPAAPLIESLVDSLRQFLRQVQGQVQQGAGQGVVRHRDISYGSLPAEKLDVYAPPDAADAPMILMIHGGGWSFGDKANRGLVRNKVNHFVPNGALFISANYPMLPSHTPDEQADAVAAAIAYVQSHASEWGGDPDNLVLMGHSAGGHLAALVSAQSDRYPDLRPWRGTVVLDSAALDLVARMEDRPPPLFRRAFGTDPAYWESVSPLLALHGATEPLLLVCASRRSDSCPQAQEFATAATSFGTDVAVSPQGLTHRQINVTLGRPGDYTDAVDAFLNRVWTMDSPAV